MSEPELSLEIIDRALETLKAEMEGPECHGTLSGLLCARGTLEAEQWLALALPDVKPAEGDLLAAEALKSLAGLFRETVRQLADSVLDFHPLLPDDDEPLEQRVDALAEWCQGFLMGLTLGDIQDFKALPADSAEVVHDLAAFSQASGYELEGGEEDEVAYADLCEYVRTGVLLVNEELNPSKAPPRETSEITYH